MRKPVLVAFLLCLLFLTTTNCSLIKKPATKIEQPKTGQPATGQPTHREKLAAEAAPPVAPEAKEALAARDYPKALEIYQAYIKQRPTDTSLQADYLAAVEAIKREADEAKKSGDFRAAISGYRLLLANYDTFARIPPGVSFGLSGLQKELRECRVGLQKTEAEKALKAKQYERAVNLLTEGLNDYPEDSSLQETFRQVAKEINLSAAAAREKKDLATAGKLYALLRAIIMKNKNYASIFPFHLEEIEKAIKNCGDSLTNSGLVEYRKGNLKEAIAIWESILIFQPENEEIKKAIQTARAQLEKIKK